MRNRKNPTESNAGWSPHSTLDTPVEPTGLGTVRTASAAATDPPGPDRTRTSGALTDYCGSPWTCATGGPRDPGGSDAVNAASVVVSTTSALG